MTTQPDAKAELIAEIANEVRHRAPADDAELAFELAMICASSASHDDLRSAGVEGMAGALLSLFNVVSQRDQGDVRVRVHNPNGEEKTWAGDRTVVELVSRDMAFLVDSVTGELNRRELTIHLALHPQICVRRDDDGRLLELLPLACDVEGSVQESVMQFQIDEQASQATLVDLEKDLRIVLANVNAVVEDWEPMRDVCQREIERLETSPPPVPADEIDEAIAFLRWVVDDHFTFLGVLEHHLEKADGNQYLRPDHDNGLGLMRQLSLRERAIGRTPIADDIRRFLRGDHLVLISKTGRQSTVHRLVHMDVVSLKQFDQGEVVGEIRFMGLFTSMAYSIAASEIPLVRSKVQRVIERTRFLPASHNAKVLRHIVEHYPRDELFQITEEDLYQFSMRILELQLRPRLAILVRRDEEERFMSCMVYVPRERHSTRVRKEIQRVLEGAFHGEVTANYTRISDRPLAQLHMIVKTRPGQIPDYDVDEIERRLTEATKTWPDRLREGLGADRGEEGGVSTWRRYQVAFPTSFQHYFTASDAIEDIPVIEEVLATNELGMQLYRPDGAAGEQFHLQGFEHAVQRPLSDLLPMLENMGLEVLSEIPFEVRPRGTVNPVWIRDFQVVASDDVDLDAISGHFKESFRRVYNGEIENDGFNRLVLGAGLDWRQVVLLRAYCKYLRQTGIAFSQTYMAQTLARNPVVARLLVELFEKRLDPERANGDAETADVSPIVDRITRSLESVQSLDEDRILRRFLNLIRSTLRTNYYQTDDDDQLKPYISFKLDGAKVLELPNPRPMFEVFVYSPRMEGVHLRGGKVARGGIRWSDRQEDFRTEILGLVKSQMVKNAVIVPVGAKGGFIVKRPPAADNREAWINEGIECYKTLIRGLLDLTDNLVDGKVVPPERVVRHDADDTYLVVAADKGTATFSDIANAMAGVYGFWLGDAFASGGSVGYDHKKMGITARGGWESVKRHFRELDRDIQRSPFTTIGVGDMSGDVFGNAMLLSEHTQLVGAFNHMHIFVDPNPGAAVSFAERQRLFALPRSTWDDYDRSLLSEGGEIYDRSAKKIEISAQTKERFSLSVDQLTPSDLIKAMLRAKVDLIWFGGIGTYLKAADESHAEVGDRANDELRVDGGEVRALVIGEGANLGATQLGRVEYALGGGRINTDFIDNSGGVDCSDHEVNIKIALRAALDAKRLDVDERVPLLVAMTDEVAELVLRDNYLQTQAISLAEYQGPSLVDEHARLMHQLERAGSLDRRLEALPDDTTLAERKAAKRGLTRPEIAVLLAHAKIALYNELLDSDLPDDPLLVRDLMRYFPEPMRDAHQQSIEGHRLRREIIATHATNSIINRVGPAFFARLGDETGRRVSDIARAYIAARDIFELRSLWTEVEALDNKLAASEQADILLATVQLLGRVIRWILRYGGQTFDIAEVLGKYEQDIVVVAAQIEELLPAQARAKVRRKYKRLHDSGLSADLAARVASLAMLPSACDVARCARVSGAAVERVGRVYFAVGERFGFDRLVRASRPLIQRGAYQRAAVTSILDDLASHQSEITRQVVEEHEGKARFAISAWEKPRRDAIRRLDQLLKDVGPAGVDLAVLTIAEREIRRLAGM